MPYSVKQKDEQGQVISEKNYKSMSQIAADLRTTYCSVRKNLQYSVNPDMKRGIKLSQVTFDKMYEVALAKSMSQ